MKKSVKGFLMALSMFSIIPVPVIKWEEENIRYMFLFYPVVGLVIGGIWFGLWYFLKYLVASVGFNAFLAGFAIMAAPYVLTGFLHLDGFCDTCDAILSRRDLERRREILKDSHIGAYGCVSLEFLLILSYVCGYSLVSKDLTVQLIAIPVISRGVAAYRIMNYKSISESGLGAMFKKSGKTADSLIMMIIVLAMFLICQYIERGRYLTPALAALFFTWLSSKGAYKNLQGFSGDLAGFSVTIGEIAGLTALIL